MPVQLFNYACVSYSQALQSFPEHIDAAFSDLDFEAQFQECNIANYHESFSNRDTLSFTAKHSFKKAAIDHSVCVMDCRGNHLVLIGTSKCGSGKVGVVGSFWLVAYDGSRLTLDFYDA